MPVCVVYPFEIVNVDKDENPLAVGRRSYGMLYLGTVLVAAYNLHSRIYNDGIGTPRAA